MNNNEIKGMLGKNETYVANFTKSQLKDSYDDDKILDIIKYVNATQMIRSSR